MGLEYYTFEDAAMRLDNTICFYDGKPYLIRAVNQQRRPDFVTLHSLWGNPKWKPVEVKYTDNKFVYKPTEIGYVNYQGRAYYVTRNPSRIQRQGLSSEVLQVHSGGISTRDLVRMKCFEDCLSNDYPSLEKASETIETADGFNASVAFHKHLAIGLLDSGETVCLYHRGQMIGLKHPGCNNFLLLNNKSTEFYRDVFKNYGVCIDV